MMAEQKKTITTKVEDAPEEPKNADAPLLDRTKAEQDAGRKALAENNARLEKVAAERAKQEAENPPPQNKIIHRPGMDIPPTKPAA